MLSVQRANQTLITLFDSCHTADCPALVQRMRELDEELWSHARMVTSLTSKLADQFRLSEHDRALLIDAAWLHDLGKLTISRTIIDKPATLDAKEWREMRTHPIRAADFLRSSTTVVDIVPLVRHHHERFDGMGYPDRLAGEAIPFGARVIAVVDAFDAMTTERAYRGAIPAGEAFTELRRCAGTQFDPEVVDAFLRAAADEKAIAI